MKHRISPAKGTVGSACVSLVLLLCLATPAQGHLRAGLAVERLGRLAMPPQTCAKRTTTADITFRCSILTPTVHVYVNHEELLVADQLVNTPTNSVDIFYGHQTVVRVTESQTFNYRVSFTTLLPHLVVWVRLEAP